MLSLLLEFALKLCNGELFAIWKAHKAAEVVRDENKDMARSDADVARELLKFTRPDAL